jgi:peptide/nickel transport system permease protein
MARAVEEPLGKASLPVSASLGGRLAERTLKGEVKKRLFGDPITLSAVILLALVTLGACFAPFVAPHDPYAVNNAIRLSAPGTPGYILGTDEIGRDIFSRLLWGGRVSLWVAIMAVVIALVAGSGLGLLAGYFGGWLDHIIMRVLDVVLAFPYILLAIGIATVLGPGINNAILAITVITIPVFARLMRATALSVREQDFIIAARALGASAPRILFRHVLPNTVSVLIVYSTLETGRMVIAAASLSFLGLGIQPPEADWGAMLASGRASLTIAPHVATIPGLVIFVVTLAFNIVGEALRDALDPRAVMLKR